MIFKAVHTDLIIYFVVEPLDHSVFHFAHTLQVCEILLQLVPIWRHVLVSIIVSDVLLIRQRLLRNGLPLDAAWVYTEILTHDLPVLISVGMYDMKDGVRQTLEWVKGVDFDGRETFDSQPRKNFTYYDQDDGTSVKVGGYYRHHDYFSVIVTP